MADPEEQDQQVAAAPAYTYPELPRDIQIIIYPNGAFNTVPMGAVFEEGAYEAGADMQRKALTALSLLAEDPEARVDLDRAIANGYYFVLDDYDGGIDSQANSGTRIMSVIHDYDSSNLMTDSQGHETAASHVYIGRHELRHTAQPEDLQRSALYSYSPLDSIKIMLWYEGDAQAEAVMHSFSQFNRTGQGQEIAEMRDDSYVFHRSTERAIAYYEDGFRGRRNVENEGVKANIRAEAFLGFVSTEEGTRHQRSIQKYVDSQLSGYEGTVRLLTTNEEGFTRALDLYEYEAKGKSGEELTALRRQVVEGMQDVDSLYQSLLGESYSSMTLGTEPQRADFAAMTRLGARSLSDNYMERTARDHQEEYRVLTTGSREELERLTGATIPQEKLDALYEARVQLALLHEANLERFRAIEASLPAPSTQLDSDVAEPAPVQQFRPR